MFMAKLSYGMAGAGDGSTRAALHLRKHGWAVGPYPDCDAAIPPTTAFAEAVMIARGIAARSSRLSVCSAEDRSRRGRRRRCGGRAAADRRAAARWTLAGEDRAGIE